jgi:predicted PurR-regulated permease PerM
MHTLLVFFSLMGEIAYFGMAGIILGPIVVALGLTFIKLYKAEFQAELLKPE